MRFSLKLVFIAVICGVMLSACRGPETGDILTPEERAWLDAHDKKIVIDRTKDTWPPVENLDADGNHIGIAPDYYRLIEKKLGFRFRVDDPRPWSERLRRYMSREIDVANNLQETPLRSEYMLFTKPYIIIPNVIIVRRETRGSLRLEEMVEMKIAVTDGFAVYEYLKTNYGYLNLMPVPAESILLRELILKRVDAVVVNLAAASYLIEKDGIQNLRIAGDVGYDNALSLASRKDWPILNSILEKGLSSITRKERNAIHDRWIHVKVEPFYMNSVLQVIFATAVLIVLISFFWNMMLRKEIRERDRIKRESEELISELQDAIGRVNTLSGLLPICSNCKRIRDDEGYWNELETYIEKHTEALFLHGLCAECEKKLGDQDWYKKKKESGSEGEKKGE